MTFCVPLQPTALAVASSRGILRLQTNTMHSPGEYERVITNNHIERTPPMVTAELAPPGFVDAECPSTHPDDIVISSTDSSTPRETGRRGGLCCGSWCDYRRATIVAISAETVMSLFWILAFYVDSWNLIYTSNLTDEGMMHIINDSNQLHALVNSITVVSCFLAFIGALRFSISAISWNIIWILLSFLAGILIRLRTTANLNIYNPSHEYQTNWFPVVVSGILSALYIYPQIAFIQEVNSGVLNPRTYSRESYSCCCQAQRVK